MLENDKKASSLTSSLGTPHVCNRLCAGIAPSPRLTRGTPDGSGDVWMPSSILVEGTLTKLGGHATKLKLRGNWRPRWCQLSPTHMAYFKGRGVRAQPAQ
jgi:hypothetical protein